MLNSEQLVRSVNLIWSQLYITHSNLSRNWYWFAFVVVMLIMWSRKLTSML